MFSELIPATANELLLASKPAAIQFFTKYFRAQIRLFLHIIHCQSDISDADLESDIDPVMRDILQALESLMNIPFDVGDPDPDKLEGTLRQFLNDCLENDLPGPVKQRIEQMLELITPV